MSHAMMYPTPRIFGDPFARPSNCAVLPRNIFGLDSRLPKVPAEYGMEELPIDAECEAAFFNFFDQYKEEGVYRRRDERMIDMRMRAFERGWGNSTLSLLHSVFIHVKNKCGRSLCEAVRYFEQLGLGESVLTCFPIIILHPSIYPKTQVHLAAVYLGISKGASHGKPSQRLALLRLANETIEARFVDRQRESFIKEELARPYAPFFGAGYEEEQAKRAKPTLLNRLRSQGSGFFHKFMEKIIDYSSTPPLEVPGLELLAEEARAKLLLE